MIKNPNYIILLFVLLIISSCKKKDTESPIVTLKGDPFITVSLNSVFVDPGADAVDNNDGAINVDIVGTVNSDFAGTYEITYYAVDAAGNSAFASRTVIVSNDANIYKGNYNEKCFTDADTTDFISTVVVSTILNKRIWIAGFADFQNATVFADITHDTIIFPEQSSQAGSPAIIHKYGGTGLIKNFSDTTVFEIYYTDSVSGNITNGFLVYKKF